MSENYFRKYKIFEAECGLELEKAINEFMETVRGKDYVNWRRVQYQYSNGIHTALVMYDGHKTDKPVR